MTTYTQINEKEYNVILRGLDWLQGHCQLSSDLSDEIDRLRFHILREYCADSTLKDARTDNTTSEFADEATRKFDEFFAQLQSRLKELMIESDNKGMTGNDAIQHILSGLAEPLYAKLYFDTYKGKPIKWNVSVAATAVPHTE